MKEGREEAFARLAAGARWPAERFMAVSGHLQCLPGSVPDSTAEALGSEPSRPPQPLLDESAGTSWLLAPGRAHLRVCALACLLLCTYSASPSNTAGGRGGGGLHLLHRICRTQQERRPKTWRSMKASSGSWFWHKADHSGDSPHGTAPAWLAPDGQPWGSLVSAVASRAVGIQGPQRLSDLPKATQLVGQSWV